MIQPNNVEVREESKFLGVIRWPCDTQSYGKTLRSRVYASLRLQALLKYFLGPIVIAVAPASMTLLFFLLEGDTPRFRRQLSMTGPGSEFTLWFVLNVGISLLVAGVAGVVMLRPFKRLIKQARSKTSTWRQEWARVEAASETMKARLSERPNMLAHQVIELVPLTPDIKWHLQEPQRIDVESLNIQLPLGAEHLLPNIRDQLLANGILALVACGGRSVLVIGDGAEPNGKRLVAIFMINEIFQFWATFEPKIVGLSIGYTLTTGYQCWFMPGHVQEGDWYAGCISTARKYFKYSEWGLLKFPAFAMLPLGIVLAPLVIIRVGYRVYRELRFQETYHKLMFEMSPTSGDSLDASLISSARWKWPDKLWAEPSVGSLSAVKLLSQKVMRAIQEADNNTRTRFS